MKKEANTPLTLASRQTSIASEIQKNPEAIDLSSCKSTFIPLSRFAVIANRYIYSIINLTLLTVILCIIVCCKRDKDSYYFNGKIQYFNDSKTVKKTINSKSVSLDGVPTGIIAVYDSLLLCCSPKYIDCYYGINNLDTGEEIGFFCKKGQGPQDANSVNPIYQFFKKENDICTYLRSNSDNKLFLWNISKSVERGITVYDTIISYKKNRYRFLFYQSDDILYVNVPSDFLSRNEISTPFYEKRTISTQEIIRNFPIYKQKSMQSSDVTGLDLAFYTWDVIKPDGTKIAQAMRIFPQINIIDTHTGDIIGYRLNKTPDFSLFEQELDIKSMDQYFLNIHADDNYIYASYWGKEPWSGRVSSGFPFVNIIHVFDWSGNHIYELITDRSFFHIWLDHVRNRLYTIDMNTDEVYYLDLNELYL